MDPTKWMANFRAAHDRARKKELNDAELKDYHSLREQLARSLLSAQGLTLPEGKDARQHFRVAMLKQIEINKLYRTLTRDLSRSGFSVLVEARMNVGDKVSFALTLGRGEEPVTGEATVVSSTHQDKTSRCSFNITVINRDNAERLEMALFDAVLSRVK